VAAEPIVALTLFNQLVTFDSAAPVNILGNSAVTGLIAGDSLVAIDFRPATGQLYALGRNPSTNLTQLYIVNPATAAATPLGGPLPVFGTSFGFDVNPVDDIIRITSDLDVNFRVNPTTGAVVAADGPLAFAGGDENVGENPQVVGVAYNNNVAGASSTTLYGIDSPNNRLVTIPNPNSGQLQTVTTAFLGFDATDLVGFDISGATGIAYASLASSLGPAAVPVLFSQLITINLTTGQGFFVGPIGPPGLIISAISVVPQRVPEPGTIALLSTGMAGLLHVRRRRRKGAA
jgi:hypothetical protein